MVIAFCIGLAKVDKEMNHVDLLQIGMAEITINLNFYSEFFPDEDQLSQLEAYAIQHRYENEVVDLLVHSLASATCTTCVIFSVPDGIFQRTVIEPRIDYGTAGSDVRNGAEN